MKHFNIFKKQNTNIFYFLLLVIIGGGWIDLNGQTEPEEEICNTTTNFNFLETIPLKKIKTHHDQFTLRVYVHVIRRDDGSGGRTLAEVQELMDLLNNAFGDLPDFDDNGESNSIRFSLEEIEYMDCDRFYTARLNNITNEVVLENNHVDGIDIYFLDEAALAQGAGTLGIPSTVLYTGVFTDLVPQTPGIDTGLSNITVHEMGHILGLYHVFQGYCSSGIQLPVSCREEDNEESGANCGDFVRDTPPVYSRGNKVNHSSNGCTYTGNPPCSIPPDANIGESDLINYMQYTHPECMSEFTPGQTERMFICIENIDILQNCLTEDFFPNEDTPIEDLVADSPIFAIQPDGELQNNEVWNTPRDVEGIVTVPNGVELIIQNTTVRFMSEQSGITVRKGGILRIDNSRLTTDGCLEPYRWKGINVHGLHKLEATPNALSTCKHGYLEIVNGSLIERADIGVNVETPKSFFNDFCTDTYYFSPPETATNGVIYIDRSIFKDNSIGIRMRNLTYVSAKNNTIQNNQFIIQKPASHLGFSVIHLDLNSAGEIDIMGNNFTSKADNNISVSIHLTGIKAVNTSINVGTLDLPKTANTFVGCQVAIDVYNTISTKFTEIHQNDFLNNSTGISLNQAPMANIRQNTFLVPATSNNNRGVVLYDAVGYNVTNNFFNLLYKDNGIAPLGIGLLAVNNDSNEFGEGIILENTFCGQFFAATQFERSNTSLQMQCNHYSNCQRDWYLANTPNAPNIIDELAVQGFCNGTSSNNPLGNTWHDADSGDFHIVNDSDADLDIFVGQNAIPTLLLANPAAINVNTEECGGSISMCNDPVDCDIEDVHRSVEQKNTFELYEKLLQGKEDEIISFLENKQAEWSDKRLVSIYTDKGEVSKATETLARIPQNTTANVAFHTMFTTILQTNGEKTTTQAERILRNYALSKEFEIATLAEMLLAQYFDKSFERTSAPILTRTSKKKTISQKQGIIYPNPAQSYIRISYPSIKELASSTHLSLLDISGKIVKVFDTPISNDRKIDIRDLETGIYFLRIQTLGEVPITEKLIIVR